MKTQEFKQVKTLGVDELKVKLVKAQEDLAQLVLDKNMKKLKDLKSLSKKKKEIAQFLTIIKQQELIKDLESRVESPEESETKVVVDNSTVKPKSKKGGRTELSK